MKEGWKYSTLGECASFARGLTYSKRDEADVSDKIVLRSNNVELGTGRLVLDELKYLTPSFEIPDDKRVKKGSLLMCMSNGSKAHLGKVALIENDLPYAFGGFMGLVTPNEDLDSKYFFYSLSTPTYKDFIKSLSAGANINNIKVKDLQQFVIPLPPLPEQQRIVSQLDSSFAKIDASKTNAGKMLDEAKALFAAALREAMKPKEGWEEKYLVKEFKLKSGEYLSSKMMINGKIPVYGGNGIAGYHNAYNIDGPHILIGRVGALCGNVHFVDEKVWVSDNAFIVNSISSFWNINFLTYELTYMNLNRYASQTAQPVISNKSMNDVLIFLPPLPEQSRIVAHLDNLSAKVRQLEANFKKVSEECDALKQAILRETFE